MRTWKNEALLSKAAITTGSFAGGIGLSQEEADRFIDFVVDESRLKGLARIERMNTQTKKINKLFLADDDVLKPGTEVTDPGETVGITTSQIVLTGKEMIAITRISDDTLEDNVEGDAFADHLMGMVARAISNQIERALLLGRLSAVPATDINQLWDGWLEEALTGGHIVDASSFSDRFITQEKLSSLVKSLPTKFRADKRNLRMLLADDIEQDYSDVLAARGTGLGDRAVLGEIPITYRSIRLAPIPLLPVDQPVIVSGGGDTTLDVGEPAGETSISVASEANFAPGDTVTFDFGGPEEESAVINTVNSGELIIATGLKFAQVNGATAKETTTDGSFTLLTDVRNLIWGIQRDVRIETDRLPRLRATDWVVTMRMDAAVENPDAMAVLKNLEVKP